ncbi:hypothetical protein D9619_011745 [Psilocybe cf. subviscida]|uniref:HAT C-terminal dimerisation domain-containing protein n=1 Tax=Psilocybe cf. subviscida TaxID=2480587 RepID=A0A8H5B0N2_9AGAR|nr:hypothetical protein D9619_011745 [Psilocybe cf. subviscida]
MALVIAVDPTVNGSRGVEYLKPVINPKIKLAWLKDHWETSAYDTARSSVIEAALAQADVFSRIKSLSQTLRKSSSLSAIPDATDNNNTIENVTLQSVEELARQADEAGEKHVEDELEAYEAAGLIAEHEPLDLLRFWQEHMTVFPLFYRIALDVLPVQASAVPFERVFSSSKETDTNRRANLSPEKFEEFQILKFGFRGERLSFTDDLVCTYIERSILDVSPDTVKDMYARGEVAQLDKFISDSWGVRLQAETSVTPPI